MNGLVAFAKSSIGAKFVMALTGVIMVGFLLGHMAGNLLIYAGQDAINAYAKGLKDLGALLWVARLGLLGSIALHIASGLRLKKLNVDARPQRYAVTRPVNSTLAGRWMAQSGIVLLAFLIYHLLHFTLGQTHPDHYVLQDAAGRHDVYGMLILGFRQPAVAISYIVAMVLIAMHLKHGVSSMFQSLGLTNQRYAPMLKKVGPAVAGLILIGNISMPLSVMTGVVGGDYEPRSAARSPASSSATKAETAMTRRAPQPERDHFNRPRDGELQGSDETEVAVSTSR